MNKSWELLRICVGYIRENSERWIKEEKDRLEKKKKEEEKQAGKELAAKKRAKGRENLLQKKITENLQKLPVADREHFQKTEDRRQEKDRSQRRKTEQLEGLERKEQEKEGRYLATRRRRKLTGGETLKNRKNVGDSKEGRR